MNKGKRFMGLLAAFALVAGAVFGHVPAKADAMRVVTLGADLSDDQKNTMLKYFKVNANEVRIINVTNQDERNHLGNYVPLEQIGTRTVSCAYVRPTTSGGIKVRTANLNWVTGNMIATSLSTSGVKNCEVIAACPFEVSGTGALTGVLMAYEVASGTALDEAKKEIATQEIVTTLNLAEEVGQDQAVNVVNRAKTEVIANNIQNADEIYNTVNNIITQNNMSVSQEEIDHIVELLEEIAAQDYDIRDMGSTLAMVNHNVVGESEEEFLSEYLDPADWEDIEAAEAAEDEDEEEDDEDDWTDVEGEEVEDDLDIESIVAGLDESILGSDVVTSSTDFADQTIANEGQESTDDDGWETFDNVDGFLVTDDMDEFDEEGVELDAEENPEVSEEDLASLDSDFENFDTEMGEEDWDDIEETDDSDADNIEDMEETVLDVEDWDISFLSETSQKRFQEVLTFAKGEYEGDVDSLVKATKDEDAEPMVTLDEETGEKLTALVLDKYLSILGNGAVAMDPTIEAVYVNMELNAMNAALKEIFGVEGTQMSDEASKILKDVDTEDLELLYEDTIAFFENLYGEVASDSMDAEEGDWEEFPTTDEYTETWDETSVEEYGEDLENMVVEEWN